MQLQTSFLNWSRDLSWYLSLLFLFPILYFRTQHLFVPSLKYWPIFSSLKDLSPLASWLNRVVIISCCSWSQDMVTPRPALKDLLHSKHNLYLHFGEGVQFPSCILDQWAPQHYYSFFFLSLLRVSETQSGQGEGRSFQFDWIFALSPGRSIPCSGTKNFRISEDTVTGTGRKTFFNGS